MDILNNDVLSYLFSLMKPQVNYFLINKRIYELRKQYMMMHLKDVHISFLGWSDSVQSRRTSFRCSLF